MIVALPWQRTHGYTDKREKGARWKEMKKMPSTQGQNVKKEEIFRRLEGENSTSQNWIKVFTSLSLCFFKRGFFFFKRNQPHTKTRRWRKKGLSLFFSYRDCTLCWGALFKKIRGGRRRRDESKMAFFGGKDAFIGADRPSAFLLRQRKVCLFFIIILFFFYFATFTPLFINKTTTKSNTRVKSISFAKISTKNEHTQNSTLRDETEAWTRTGVFPCVCVCLHFTRPNVVNLLCAVFN